MLCQCGCGKATNIAAQTRPLYGTIKGEPQRFVSGHHRRDPLFHAGLKRCTKCAKVKPLSEYKPRRRGTSVEPFCRPCGIDMQRDKRMADATKSNARATLHQAIRRGAVKRPDHCGRCQKKCIPHGHHTDYSRPLDVAWLCSTCHAQEHARAIALAEQQ